MDELLEPAYLRTCPVCGGPVAPNAQGPETAPWRCDECGISWWCAELTPFARLHFDRYTMSWGTGGSESHLKVRRWVELESQRATIRGTSVRQDQVGLLHPDTRIAIAKNFRIHSSFRPILEPHTLFDEDYSGLARIGEG